MAPEQVVVQGRQPSLAAVVWLWLRAIDEGPWIFPPRAEPGTVYEDEEARLRSGQTMDVLAFIRRLPPVQ